MSGDISDTLETPEALRDHLLALFQQARDDVAAFVTFGASERDHDRAAQDLIGLIGFWMEYNVERLGYFARGDAAPHNVDFDALTQAALTENAARTWPGSVAYAEAAFDHLSALVAARPDLLLAANGYDEEPGGPAWGEVRANGFIWPLQELEKYYAAHDETERAAELHTQLVAELGEDEPPIVCDLLAPEAIHAQRGDLLVIDVRSASEFAAGHLAGARNIPLAALPDRLAELPDGGRIITYCNMQHPGHSRGERAAALLSARGYHAAALAGGFSAWREAGLPVE